MESMLRLLRMFCSLMLERCTSEFSVKVGANVSRLAVLGAIRTMTDISPLLECQLRPQSLRGDVLANRLVSVSPIRSSRAGTSRDDLSFEDIIYDALGVLDTHHCYFSNPRPDDSCMAPVQQVDADVLE